MLKDKIKNKNIQFEKKQKNPNQFINKLLSLKLFFFI
jgi:hypothetical protein